MVDKNMNLICDPNDTLSALDTWIAGVVGWVLRHRKALTIGYLVLLHVLVYYSLTHGLFGSLTHHTVTHEHREPCIPPLTQG